MSLLNALLGTASDVAVDEIQRDYAHVLLDGEEVAAAFRVVRDLYVFTDWRALLVDRQGLSGRKVELLTIPYRSITAFSIETAGTFDMDSELTLWISGRTEPLRRTLRKDAKIEAIHRAIAAGLAGRAR